MIKTQKGQQQFKQGVGCLKCRFWHFGIPWNLFVRICKTEWFDSCIAAWLSAAINCLLINSSKIAVHFICLMITKWHGNSFYIFWSFFLFFCLKANNNNKLLLLLFWHLPEFLYKLFVMTIHTLFAVIADLNYILISFQIAWCLLKFC